MARLVSHSTGDADGAATCVAFDEVHACTPVLTDSDEARESRRSLHCMVIRSLFLTFILSVSTIIVLPTFSLIRHLATRGSQISWRAGLFGPTVPRGCYCVHAGVYPWLHHDQRPLRSKQYFSISIPRLQISPSPLLYHLPKGFWASGNNFHGS